jgi:hypothetical protein
MDYGMKDIVGDMETVNAEGLNNGEWFITTSTGTVKGIATCNNIVVDMESIEAQSEAGTITMEDALSMMIRSGDTFNQNSTGANCWCKVTSLNNVACPESNWVFESVYDYYDSSEECMADCTRACTKMTDGSEVFRSLMFGQPLTSD